MHMRNVSVLLFAFTACAGTNSTALAPTSEPAAPPSRLAVVTNQLLECRTSAEMRTLLAGGMPERELQRFGFDQVTLAECIDCVLVCAAAFRERPEDPVVAAKLADSVDLYLAVQRDINVGRTAGAASCIQAGR
jgi:hypothetical protein